MSTNIDGMLKKISDCLDELKLKGKLQKLLGASSTEGILEGVDAWVKSQAIINAQYKYVLDIELLQRLLGDRTTILGYLYRLTFDEKLNDIFVDDRDANEDYLEHFTIKTIENFRATQGLKDSERIRSLIAMLQTEMTAAESREKSLLSSGMAGMANLGKGAFSAAGMITKGAIKGMAAVGSAVGNALDAAGTPVKLEPINTRLKQEPNSEPLSPHTAITDDVTEIAAGTTFRYDLERTYRTQEFLESADLTNFSSTNMPVFENRIVPFFKQSEFETPEIKAMPNKTKAEKAAREKKKDEHRREITARVAKVWLRNPYFVYTKEGKDIDTDANANRNADVIYSSVFVVNEKNILVKRNYPGLYDNYIEKIEEKDGKADVTGGYIIYTVKEIKL